MSFLQIRRTRAVRDQLLTFKLVELSSFLQQNFFKFLLVKFAGVLADFNQHLDGGSNLSFFDNLSFSLVSDLLDEQLNQSLFDDGVLDDVVLELTVLHILDEGKVELGDEVFVHVKQDVSDHDDAVLDFLPNTIELAQELVFMRLLDVLRNWLQQLHRCVLNRLVKHLPVLVQH